MHEYLVVDGYNIIGSWPHLVKLKDINLEEARDQLIHVLADYQGFSGIPVCIVFDAYHIPGLGGKYEQSKLRIVYTKEKETADELIERLVTEMMGRRKRVYVATSDLTEQNVIFGKGALRISARELLDKVRESDKEIRRNISERTSTGRNSFDSHLSNEVKKQFEKWRRGH
jgi:predicted RNA-binding protein with PIN domain